MSRGAYWSQALTTLAGACGRYLYVNLGIQCSFRPSLTFSKQYSTELELSNIQVKKAVDVMAKSRVRIRERDKKCKGSEKFL